MEASNISNSLNTFQILVPNSSKVQYLIFILFFTAIVSSNAIASNNKTLNNTSSVSFSFDCSSVIPSITFLSNSLAQNGTAIVKLSNVVGGNSSFSITSANGFSGGIATTILTNGQTSISLPIQFNGLSPVGIYALTISSPNAINSCTVYIAVNACSTFSTSITAKTTTTLCIGDSAKLVASTGASYIWNTGETSATIIKKTAGNYTVTVTEAGGCKAVASAEVTVKSNCVSGLCGGQLADASVNITFGTGSRTDLTNAVPGATTTHIYTPTGAIIDGRYAVANNASEAGAWAAAVEDHSGDGTSGRLMVVNADNTPKECFRMPISGLCNNLLYQFSAWIRSISNKPEKPNVTFEIRDAITDSLLAIKGTDDIKYGTWIQHGLLFNTANHTNFTLVLRNNTIGGANGNDLVIDDIQFAYCGPPVVIAMTGGVFNSTTGVGTACLDKNLTFTSTVAPDYLIIPQYQWQVSTNNGASWSDISGATNATFPFVSGTNYAGKKYRLLVAETGYITTPECRVSSNIISFNLSNGAAEVSINKPLPQICAGDSITLTAPTGTNYNWNTGENTGSINKKTGGIYSVTFIDTAGCEVTGSKTIILNANPIPNITASGLSNLNTSGSATLTASGGTGYLWNTGQNTASITITTAGTYSVTVSNNDGCKANISQIVAPNNPPTASNSTSTAASGIIFNGDITSNVHDLDGNLNPNSFTITDSPKHGTISMNPNGTYTYTPSSNFTGIDSVHYKVCDLSNICTTATIIFTVNNQAPTLTNATPSVTEDIPLTGNVSKNAADVNNNLDPNGFSVTDDPKHGSIVFNPNGTYTYTPEPNFNGIDSVHYKVCDVFGLCTSATIVFTINPTNDPPVLNNATPAVTEDTPISSTVAPNASDIDNNLNPNSFVLTDSPLHGTAKMNPDGTYTYTPNPNFIGIDSVHYKVCDLNNVCTIATIVFTVNPVNDAPDAVLVAPDIVEDSTVTFCGLITDPDIGDAFTAVSCNTPIGFAAPKVTNNQLCLTYTPKKDFNGQDTVCLLICDKAGLCDTLKVPLTILPRNDAPSVIPTKITVDLNTETTQCYPIIDVDLNDTHTATLCGVKSGTANIEVKNGELCVTYKTTILSVTKDTICVNVCDMVGSCVKVQIPVAVNPCNNVNPPTFICPAKVAVSTIGTIVSNDNNFINSVKIADNCSGVVLNFTPPTATDDCNTPSVKQVSGNLSGSIFKQGINSLVFEATDSDNKKSTCKIDVLVSPFNFVSPDSLVVCIQENLTISAQKIDSATYKWAGPDNISLNLSSFSFTLASKSQSGLYIVTIGLNNGCSFKDTLKIITRDVPNLKDSVFKTNNTQDVTGNVLQNVTLIPSANYVLKITKNTQNGTVTLDNKGQFTYKPNGNFVGTDGFLYELCYDICPNTCYIASASIEVSETPLLKPTEIITPNGDGVNEGLVIEGHDPTLANDKSEIIIYNQWGDVVHRAAPYKNDWKGTYNDLTLPEGTYYFIFKLNPDSAPVKSFVTIIR
jgi:gliding motility-associated-like protein